MAVPTCQPRDSRDTILYQVVAEHLETFLAGIDADPTAKGLPSSVRDEYVLGLSSENRAAVRLRDLSPMSTTRHEALR
jgi:hypothetical protein